MKSKYTHALARGSKRSWWKPPAKPESPDDIDIDDIDDKPKEMQLVTDSPSSLSFCRMCASITGQYSAAAWCLSIGS